MLAYRNLRNCIYWISLRAQRTTEMHLLKPLKIQIFKNFPAYKTDSNYSVLRWYKHILYIKGYHHMRQTITCL